VFERAVSGMAADGTPFCGVLFAGLMLTDAGEPVLLEFNVRFGDPETQVLMPLLDGDLGEALSAAALGKLDRSMLRSNQRHALCVVLAAHGYPDTPRKGDRIEGVDEAAELPGVQIFHAGTRLEGAELQTAGGRVLGVTGHGNSLEQARDRAYRAADVIRFDGKQLRRDIGARALG
jgi:phosphoribosylamine--glycine ligase